MQEASAPAKRRLQGVLNAALLTGAVLATIAAVAVIIGLFWWISFMPSASVSKPLAASAQKPQRPGAAGEPAGEAAAPPSGAVAPPAAGAPANRLGTPPGRIGAPPKRAGAPPAAEAPASAAPPPAAEAAPPAAAAAPPAGIPAPRIQPGHRQPRTAPPAGQARDAGVPQGDEQ